MIELKINKTMNYTGNIMIDDIQAKTMSQTFNEKGHRSGPIGEYVVNQELYYSNIEQCRKQEDAFLNEMRKIEDEYLVKEEENGIQE